VPGVRRREIRFRQRILIQPFFTRDALAFSAAESKGIFCFTGA
jgi:hypothetical protein